MVTDRDSGDSVYAEQSILASKYKVPYDLVCQLLTADPDAIIKLRKVQPILGKITSSDFASAKVQVDTVLMNDLLKPMIYLK